MFLYEHNMCQMFGRCKMSFLWLGQKVIDCQFYL